jgi:D-alanyl-lipoteichoic acid acyltransferase DltB (MBOAT superfamily)
VQAVVAGALMLFNSYAFLLVFLPLTLAAFAGIAGRSPRGAALLLVLAAAVFYGWGSPWRHVLVLAVMIVFNFAIARQLGRAAGPAACRALLVVGISADLVVLGYFKYASFFLDQIGLGGRLVVLLPLGISFYTFTQIAYLIDVYRGKAREYDPAHYALFVSWFPHLIAGPIIHHKEMMSQFAEAFRTRIQPGLVVGGLSVFAVGLAKKVLLADSLAPFADAVFRSGPQIPLTFAEAWTGALAYTLQIYFDFSGYSDMAIGLSLMFGVRLPLNFNSPYKAASIVDFWRRWHMTLSRFLREYLYIPLGGNRHGTPRRYINLMATMLIGGLWHGAGWTFVAWGGLHGVYLVVNHAWRAVKIPLPRFPAAALTFLAVVVAWVFFRASDFATAASLLHAMAFGHGLSLPRSLPAWPAIDALGLHLDGAFHNDLFRADRAMLTVGVGLAAVWMLPNTQQLFSHLRPALSPADGREEPSWSRLVWRPSWRWGCAFGLLSAASFVALGGESPFLYFRF